MSYQVIARKWRPQTFTELVGQNHVAQTLVNGLRSGRIAHALLFTGPRGTGKTSSARILAKSIRCPKAVDFVPCNSCTECKDISQGRALDVLEIDGASHNGVEAVRELRDSVGFMPASGRYKIYIIDEVHMLSTAAFNALLKTLEEPPPHVIFILATTEVQKIPNTILSRCQRMDFRRISAREVVDRLKTICEQEGVGVDEASLWLIARQSEGSMRDSQSLLDQVITFSGGNLTAETTAEALGLSDRSLLRDTLKVLVTRDEAAAANLVGRVYQAGIDAKIFVNDLLFEIRNLLLVRMGLESSHQLIDLPEFEVQALKALGENLSAEDIHFLFDMTLKGAQDVTRAFDPQLVLEMLMFRMAAAPRIRFIAELATLTPDRASAPVALEHASQPQRAASTIDKLAPVESLRASEFKETAPHVANKPTTLDERWYQLVSRVNQRTPALGAKLAHVRLVFVDESTQLVRLGVSTAHKFLYDQLATDNNKKLIAEKLRDIWGKPYSIEIQLGEDADAKQKSPQELTEELRTERQASVRQQVESHPVIQDIQRVMKAEIRSIRDLKESP